MIDILPYNELYEAYLNCEQERYELLEKNNRLNNIINEMEKWLEDMKLSYISLDIDFILNKLQELKDSDEE